MRTAMASVIAALLATPSLFAQAWVPAKGDGTVAIVYQNQLVRDHLFSDGGRIDVGHITSNGVLLDFGVRNHGQIGVGREYPRYVPSLPGPPPAPRIGSGRRTNPRLRFRICVSMCATTSLRRPSS